MRTTLTIDDDLLEAARALAQQRRVSLGQVVSELLRKGLSPTPGFERNKRGNFPTFAVPEAGRPITLETVKRAEEEL